MSLDPYKRKRCRSRAPTAFSFIGYPQAQIKRKTLIPPLQINFCYRNCYTNSSVAESVAVTAISCPHMSSLIKGVLCEKLKHVYSVIISKIASCSSIALMSDSASLTFEPKIVFRGDLSERSFRNCSQKALSDQLPQLDQFFSSVATEGYYSAA